MPTCDRDTLVITTMNRKILDVSGRTMLCSLLARWPSDTRAMVFYEKKDDADLWLLKEELEPEIDVIDLLGTEPDLVAFNKRNSKRSKGLLKHAATRFSFKSFAITGVADFAPDRAVWLDADTITHTDVTEEDLSRWLPNGKAVSFLGRCPGYTETGFLMFDMNWIATRTMLNSWRTLYLTDQLFLLPEWHDCMAFDNARIESLPTDIQNNLTPWGMNYDHVFINSPVGACMDHMKGPRKKAGTSRLKDCIPGRVTPGFMAYLRRK